MALDERTSILSGHDDPGSVKSSDSHTPDEALRQRTLFAGEASFPSRSRSSLDLEEPRDEDFHSGSALNESRHGGSYGPENEASQDSLDLLINKHRITRDSSGTTALDMAAFTVLPESTLSLSPDTTSRVSSLDLPEAPSLLHIPVYSREIYRLQSYMPHLKNVGSNPRAHNIDIAELECWDYSHPGSLTSRSSYSVRSDTRSSKVEFMRQVVDEIPSNVTLRLLVAEDLSQRSIRILGGCLGINPEFFEEHLLNSGWRNNYADSESDSWNTRDLTKDYASIKWYRPILGRTPRPNLHQTQDARLDSSETPELWSEVNPRNRYVWHHTNPLVHILRRPWEVELGPGSFSAWEERATVFRKLVGPCEVGA